MADLTSDLSDPKLHGVAIQREAFKHEEDPLFFSDHLDHLSSLGWTYYNETLDDFFHGRDPNL